MLNERKVTHDDANNLYAGSMRPPLPYADIEFDGRTSLKTKLATADDAEIDNFVKVNSTYRENLEKKQNFHHFVQNLKK